MPLPFVLSLFLYFPEDKTEYIPAVIKLVIVIILAVIVLKAVIKWSKREELKAKELEERIKVNTQEKDS